MQRLGPADAAELTTSYLFGIEQKISFSELRTGTAVALLLMKAGFNDTNLIATAPPYSHPIKGVSDDVKQFNPLNSIIQLQILARSGSDSRQVASAKLRHSGIAAR